MMERKLRRVTEHEWIGGVCAGIGYWIGIPVWIVRLFWTCIFLFVGIGAIVYILLWIFVSKWEDIPEDYYEVTGD